MKNYKKIRWIEEPKDQLDEKFGSQSLTSSKEDKSWIILLRKY
jgi:hypothetical protein